jgi:hypothetical protein
VRFDFAPPAKKPRQNKPKKSDTETSGQPENRVPSDASSGSPAKETLPSSPADAESAQQKQEWEAKLEAYKKEKKQRRLPLAGLNAIRSVREFAEPTARDPPSNPDRHWGRFLYHAGRGAESAGADHLHRADSQGR